MPSGAESLRSFAPAAAADHPDSLEAVLAANAGRVAAVLLAPPYGPPLSTERMQAIRRLCDTYNVLLILDEIVTGFRLSLGGAQGLHEMRADITCLAKGLGAGMPIAAICGATSVMTRLGELHVSSTYAGETLSLAAVMAAINEYATTDYFARLWRLGGCLREAMLAQCTRLGLPALLDGYAPIPTFRFDALGTGGDAMARLFLAECAERGCLFRRDVNFITGAHREEDIAFAIAAAGEAFAAVAQAC